MSKVGCWIFAGTVLVFALLSFPVWGMGPAVFLDSDRTIRASEASPDGSKIANIEELVVGGVPNIVVIVRDSWLPNWYLTGCVASSHYEDVDVTLEWTSDSSIELTSKSAPRYWNAESAPFRNDPCDEIATTIGESAR